MTGTKAEGRLKEVLATDEHQAVDKVAQIKAFVASQSRYARTYKAEGSKECSSWNTDWSAPSKVGVDSKSSQTQQHKLAGHGFSSPILKPRNENAGLPHSNPSKQDDDQESTVDPAVDSNDVVRRDKCRSALEKPSKSSTGLQKRHAAALKTTKQPPHTHAQKNDVVDKERAKKRKRMSSDAERSEILAQRRERRRLKKVTMSAAKEDSLEPTGSKSKDVQKKSSKNRPLEAKNRTSLPAGLALMHGFSAKNVGKQRITLEPPPFVGVFNKGRASGKQSVTSKKQQKAAKLFNESSFLSKAVSPQEPGHLWSKEPDSESSSSILSCSHGSYNDVVQGNRSNPKTRPRTTDGASSPHVDMKTPQPLSKEDDLSLSDHSVDYKSEIWDIEKEFLEQEHDGATTSGKPDSIVLNSKKWDWHNDTTMDESRARALVSKNTNAEDCRTTPVIPASDLARDRNSTLSSLGPSQSASQVPPRASPALVASRHFDPPSEGIESFDPVQERAGPCDTRLQNRKADEDSLANAKRVDASSKACPTPLPSHSQNHHQQLVEGSTQIILIEKQSSDGLLSLQAAIDRLENEEINTELHLDDCADVETILPSGTTQALLGLSIQHTFLDLAQEIAHDPDPDPDPDPYGQLYSAFMHSDMHAPLSATETNADVIQDGYVEESGGAFHSPYMNDGHSQYTQTVEEFYDEISFSNEEKKVTDCDMASDWSDIDDGGGIYRTNSFSDLSGNYAHQENSTEYNGLPYLGSESDVGSYPPSAPELEGEGEMGSLENAEAAVAEVFRSRWYPIKF